MRFYIQAIQHNYEKNAENREAPKGFDFRDDAESEFHDRIAKDTKNVTLDWGLVLFFNSAGGVEEKPFAWKRDRTPQPQPKPEEEPADA